METHIFSGHITYFIENVNWLGILVIMAVIGYAIACYIKIYKDYRESKEEWRRDKEDYNRHKDLYEDTRKLKDIYLIKQFVRLPELCKNNRHLEMRLYPIDNDRQDILIIGGDDGNFYGYFSTILSFVLDDIKKYGYKIVYEDNTVINLYREYK